MRITLEERLERWREAGLLDGQAIERIRAWENARPSPVRSRWPVVVSLAAGGLMLAAGALLFVAAHWDGLSPAARFGLLLATLTACHGAAASASTRSPYLATTLHAVGTAVLGAAIFLAGQTFHLETSWPEGFLLWAIGAWAAYALLRGWPQLVFAALLTPAWVVAEWADRMSLRGSASPVLPAAGLLLLAVTYLFAERKGVTELSRVALAAIGATTVIPLSAMTILFVSELRESAVGVASGMERVLWWAVAIGGPLLVAVRLRGREAWPSLVAAGWVAAGVALGRHPGVLSYVWAAVGAIGIALAGVRDGLRRPINLGLAGFAITVVVFYFSSVLDKLGRATSLLSGGLLFLALAWGLDRLRRRLLARTTGAEL